jgi:ribosomal-protein-alanine acetyltransferase
MAPAPNADVLVAPLAYADIDAVCALETRIAPCAWRMQQFYDSLDAGHRGWIVRDRLNRLMGYALWMCAADEASLLTLGVAPEQQRCGVATRLLDHSQEALREQGVCALFLEVRAGNAPAIGLYTHWGFVRIGVRRGYYASRPAWGLPVEDALTMMKRL